MAFEPGAIPSLPLGAVQVPLWGQAPAPQLCVGVEGDPGTVINPLFCAVWAFSLAGAAQRIGAPFILHPTCRAGALPRCSKLTVPSPSGSWGEAPCWGGNPKRSGASAPGSVSTSLPGPRSPVQRPAGEKQAARTSPRGLALFGMECGEGGAHSILPNRRDLRGEQLTGRRWGPAAPREVVGRLQI